MISPARIHLLKSVYTREVDAIARRLAEYPAASVNAVLMMKKATYHRVLSDLDDLLNVPNE